MIQEIPLAKAPHFFGTTRQVWTANLQNRGKIFLLLGCMLIVLSGCFSFPQPPAIQSSLQRGTSTPTSNNAVLITIPQAGTPIPEDFIGFHIEVSQVCEIIQLDQQKSATYEHLYTNLGSSVLHIGGHTADLSEWVPDGVPSCRTNHSIVTKALIDALFAFARRIHWKVSWGLNLIANNPRSAANEAAYVAAVGGSDFIGFSIGNEPELYVKYGYRPSSWGYTNYLNEWNQYRNAILSIIPSAKFNGPDACCETTLLPNFLSDERQYLTVATHHYYPKDKPPATPSFLLSKQVSQKFVTVVSKWIALAKVEGLHLELSESNTITDGGIAGVSDSFAAALWASDDLFRAAELGVLQVDFQSAQMKVYDAIDDNGTPKALYYGLLFFHTVTQQSKIVQATIHTAFNITAYAVLDSRGSLRVVLVNKDSRHSATIAVNTPRLYRSATIMRLIAPTIGVTTSITVGGSAVSAQGTWTPSSSEPLALHGTAVDVQVPAGSATSIEFLG
jgi:hypothetical protein